MQVVERQDVHVINCDISKAAGDVKVQADYVLI
jgi:hypothetical protein